MKDTHLWVFFEDWKNINEFIIKNENRSSIEVRKVKQFAN
jgi:hypothetical protein